MTEKQARRDHLTITRLQALLDLDCQLLDWAQDWAEGFSPTSPSGGQRGETGGSKGDHATPVEAQTINNLEGNEQGRQPEGLGLAARCLALHERIAEVIAIVNKTSYEAKQLKPLTARSADLKARQQEPRHWGTGECAVCGGWATGGAGDKLKGGLCQTHYDQHRYALRMNPSTSPPLDRQQWIRDARTAHDSTTQSESTTASEHNGPTPHTPAA